MYIHLLFLDLSVFYMTLAINPASLFQDMSAVGHRFRIVIMRGFQSRQSPCWNICRFNQLAYRFQTGHKTYSGLTMQFRLLRLRAPLFALSEALG